MALLDTLKQHAQEVAALENAQAEEFLKLLRALRTTLEGRFAAITDQGSFDAFNIRRVVAETEQGISVLGNRGSKIYKAGAVDAAELSAQHMSSELEMLSKKFDGKMLNVDIDAAKVLADPAQALLANHFETSLERYGGELLNGVRQRLFIALRTGDPVSMVVKDIASQSGPMGTVGIDKAKLLVRTETSNAYGAAAHNGITQAAKKIPGLGKMWIHIGSYPCPTCMPLNGTTRPVNGTWTIESGKKTYKVSHSPAHPRCACKVVASKPSWKAGLDKLGYGLSDK